MRRFLLGLAVVMAAGSCSPDGFSESERAALAVGYWQELSESGDGYARDSLAVAVERFEALR